MAMRKNLIMIVLLAGIASAPLVAQSDVVSLRVEKLEKEMKAVQRKVFPNGQPIQPEISGPKETDTPGSTSALADLTTRVDALEGQLKQLTGQIESQSSRLKRVEEQNKSFETRVKALEASKTVEEEPVAAVPIDEPAKPKVVTASTVKPTVVKPATTTPGPKTSLAAPAIDKSKSTTTTAKPDAKRKAQIDAVEVPRTGDATEDAYVYGYRLWNAKLYPEARVKLREVITKYPKHKRASHAQNLVGKSYMDEGLPGRAAEAFFEHYDKNAKGERSDDSLYNLGVVLTKMNKLTDACRVFTEFTQVYGATTTAALKAKVAKGRTDAKCSV